MSKGSGSGLPWGWIIFWGYMLSNMGDSDEQQEEPDLQPVQAVIEEEYDEWALRPLGEE